MTVYFAQAGDGGPIKVGFTTKAVCYRVRLMQLACPWPLKIIAEFQDWDRAQEKRVLRMFAPHRIRGEWFKAHADIFAFVHDHASETTAVSHFPIVSRFAREARAS